MGVHGLWQLLHPSGRPVTLESLEGKVLAVDVSIWLHQAMKGMRDKDGNVLPNAHLQGLFSRVCKLLFYRIKPVFVFDGGVPDLKKHTLAARREKKSEAQKERDEIGKKLLQNLIKSQAVKQALGAGSSGGPPVRVPGVKGKRGENDLFELAPLPEALETGLTLNSEAWHTDFEQQENWIKEGLATLSKVDPDSKEFKSLPMEIQHEALVDLKEERKYHTLSHISKMPEDADSFSSYQLKKLMKVSDLTSRIEEVRKEMSNKTTRELSCELGDDYYGEEVEARRIVSEDASHYILIKGLTKQKQMEEAEQYELDRRIKIEKEEDERDKTQNVVEKPPSSYKRPTQERNEYVAHKKMKSGKGKGGKQTQPSWTRSGLLASAISDDNDGVDEMSDEKDEESNDFETSSSEDEGFIEVTFDPNQTAEEDDLFPASIFQTTMDSIASTNTSSKQTAHAYNLESLPSHEQFTVKEEPDDCVEFVSSCHENENRYDSDGTKREKGDYAKKGSLEGTKKSSETINESNYEADSDLPQSEEPGSISKSLSAQLGNTTIGGMKDMTHKRKNVLNDILAELQKKKEALESLSVEEGDLNSKNEEEREINAEVDEEEILPGGFLREGSISSDDDDVRNDKKANGMSEYNNYVYKKNIYDESDDDAMMSLQNERMNDSEDEDLKLAIELSLQSAREERGESSEETTLKMMRNSDFQDECPEALSPLSEKANVAKDTFGNDDALEGEDSADDDVDADEDFEMVESIEGEEVMNSHMNTNTVSEVDPYSEEGDKISSVEKDVNHDDTEMDKIAEVDEIESVSQLKTSMDKRNSGVDINSPSKMQSQERLQPEDLDDPFTTFQQNNLLNIREELESERTNLLSEQGRQERFATSLTDQIVLEAQELLNMFGIPYVVSPMEAEAQCAFLDVTKQTQGTITDDSDIWLFGGTRVYKNFFNQSKFVEFFSVDSIKSHFGLTREQLIKIALLCGSDYTVGVQGVGPVRALEIMGEFHGDGLTGLMAFRKWWDVHHKKPAMPGENKLRSRLKQLSLERGFPSERVMEAYLCPAVDESRERFSWGQPDLDLLRQFARMKFGWAREKSDSILEPMMKQFLKKRTQDRIYSYFQPTSYVPSSTATAHSDRIKKALSVMQAQKSSAADYGPVSSSNNKNTQAKKRRNAKDETVGNKANHEEGDDSEVRKTLKSKKNLKTGSKMGSFNQVVAGDSGGGLRKKSKGILKAKGNIGEGKDGKAERKTMKDVDTFEKDNSRLGIDDPTVHSALMEKRIKVEKKSDDDDDDFEGLNKCMQGTVAKDNSVSSKNGAKRGRGGRGGGGGGGSKSKSVKGRVLSAVPSLERSVGVKGRGGRSQRGKSSSRNVALNRGVVCLSESSSDDGDNDDYDDSDNDGRKEEDYFYLRGKVGKCDIETVKNVVSDKLSAKANQQKSVSENKMANKDEGNKASVQPHPSKPKVSKDCEAGQDSESPGRTSLKADGITKIKGDEIEKPARKESSTPREEIERKAQKKDLTVEKNIEVKRAKRTPGDLVEELDSDKEKVTEVGQVPGKDPDVSIINAMTLKATMSYLNQRSMGEKQLLNALGGKKAKNAVERRLEEEERRERRGGMERLTGVESNQTDVKKNKTKHAEQKRPRMQTSFEDMLAGAEVSIKTKSMKLGELKKTNNAKADLKQTVGKNAEKKLGREMDGCGSVGGVQTKGKKVDEFGLQVSYLSDFQSVKDHGRLPPQDWSMRSQALDIPMGISGDKGSDEQQIRSKRSQAFDVPIDISGDKGSDQLQIRSKKSQAFDVPIGLSGDKGSDQQQIRSKKSQAFDVPIVLSGDKGSDQQQIRSKKSQAFDAPIGGDSTSRTVAKGRAVAGKGKGIGKNRNGRQQQQQKEQLKRDVGGRVARSTDFDVRLKSGLKERSQEVSSVLASSGVSEADIVKYGSMTMDDLGSDFDDDEF